MISKFLLSVSVLSVVISSFAQETDTLSVNDDTLAVISVTDTVAVNEMSLSAIDSLRLHLQQLRAEREAIEAEIADSLVSLCRMDSVVADRRAMVSKHDSLTTETAKTQKMLILLQYDLSAAYEECKGCLSDVDIARLKSVIVAFDSNKATLECIDDALYKEMETQVMFIRNIAAVAEPLQRGLHLMSGVFDAEKNKECAYNINTVSASSKVLTVEQKKEVETIVAALSAQEDAYYSLCDLLSYVERRTDSGTMNIEGIIRAYVGPVSASDTAYSPYYKRFNRILEKLRLDHSNIPQLKKELNDEDI